MAQEKKRTNGDENNWNSKAKQDKCILIVQFIIHSTTLQTEKANETPILIQPFEYQNNTYKTDKLVIWL